ncbi:lipid-A-disaccharide synthase [Desulfuromonas versatilis]|uniref:lipid-A-disaccharide synthase n=1 Tax=Desulfuromonas versatilis TaxID=2802975 RepID=UPI001CEDE0F1
MIVTGEASGDLHGANLIRAAGQIDPELAFFGVGGKRMAAAGCEILIPGEEISVMGLVEVLGHFPQIYRAFNRLKGILHGPERPDLLILIDFPDFNLRLARQAKLAGVPVLYYVSPQVWAWRRGRVKKIARIVDRLAAVFPFEPEIYAGHDIEVEYVGHPLLDEVHVEQTAEQVRARHGIPGPGPVVGLFPGSRKNELRYCLETILASAERILQQKPDTRFLLPVAPSLESDQFSTALAGRSLPVTLVEESIYDVANACDAVISVSGTVTLQTALVGTPMAIIYKMAPLTFAIGKRLIKVPFIGLANIVAGRGVVREFIQDAASPEAISEEILRILDDPQYNARMREGLATVKDRMGEGGCSLRVARMASDLSRRTPGGKAV